MRFLQFSRCAALSALVCFTPPALAQSPAPSNPAAIPADPFTKEPGSAASLQKTLPPPPGEGHSLLVFETYAVPLSLSFEILEPPDGPPARMKHLAELVRSGKARLVNLIATAAKPGRRNSAESADGFRYPVEFMPPEGPHQFPIGTAFETRNVGDSIEHELTFHSGDPAPSLDYALKRVVFLGMRDFSEPPGDPPNTMPNFEAQNVTGNLRLPSGDPQLVNTFTPPARKGRQVLADPEIWFTFAKIQPHPLPSQAELKPVGFGAIVEYTFFSLDRGAAAEALQGGAGLDAAWQATQRLSRENKAHLEHAMVLPIEPNRRSRGAESTEFSYPTEFQPPGTARRWIDSTEVTRTEDRSAEAPASGKPQSANRTSISERTMREAPADKPERTPGCATAFEWTDLGYSIDQELTLNPARTAGDLSVNIGFISYQGPLQYPGTTVPLVSHPLFECRSQKTVVLAASGQHILVGTLNPPGENGVNGRQDSGKVWLCFAQITSPQP